MKNIRGKKDLRFINLAANKDYLILNHDYSESFDVLVFCPMDQHFDMIANTCQQNPEGYYNIELPRYDSKIVAESVVLPEVITLVSGAQLFSC